MNIYPVNEIYQKLRYKQVAQLELNDDEVEIYRQFSINDIITNDAGIIKNKEAELLAVLNAIDELKKKAENIESFIENSKFNLKVLLMENHIDKVKTPYFDVRISKNIPSTEIYNETEIPEEYVKEKVTKSLDKQKMLNDMKLGVIIPGVRVKQDLRIEIK